MWKVSFWNVSEVVVIPYAPKYLCVEMVFWAQGALMKWKLFPLVCVNNVCIKATILRFGMIGLEFLHKWVTVVNTLNSTGLKNSQSLFLLAHLDFSVWDLKHMFTVFTLFFFFFFCGQTLFVLCLLKKLFVPLELFSPIKAELNRVTLEKRRSSQEAISILIRPIHYCHSVGAWQEPNHPQIQELC